MHPAQNLSSLIFKMNRSSGTATHQNSLDPSLFRINNSPARRSLQKYRDVKQHLLFIADDVKDYQVLLTGLKPGIPVHILPRGQDGVRHITDVIAQIELRSLHSLSIHIVSHGDPGSLYLGNSQLNLSTLNRYINDVKTWFSPQFFCSGQSENSALYLYGCSVAATETGQQFLTQLRHLTGATIYASTTKVGNASQGGNWELDITIPSPVRALHATPLPSCPVRALHATPLPSLRSYSLSTLAMNANAIFSANALANFPGTLAADGGGFEAMPASPQVSNSSKELVVIDAGVADKATLIADFESRGVEYVVLDDSADGVQQITEALAGRSDLDALHIISHGSEGQAQLGNGVLSEETLDEYSDALGDWGDALGADADILFYGCNLAEGPGGTAFIAEISALTGADIAASNDLTGAAHLGGDFDLEVQTGAIEADIALSAAAQADFDEVLNPGGVSTGLNLWLNASAGTTNTTTPGGAVNSWLDSSGNGIDLATVGTGTNPTYQDATTENTFNFNPSIQFDDFSDHLANVTRSPVTDGNNDTEFFLVVDTDDANWVYSLNAAPPFGDWDQGLFRDTQYYVDNTGFSTLTFPSVSDPALVNINVDSANNNGSYTRDGGVTTATGNVTPVTADGPLGTAGVVLGADYNLGQPGTDNIGFTGNVAEVIHFDQRLTDADRNKVVSYLGLKYGISLNGDSSSGGFDYTASNNTVYWGGTTNTAYHNDVAGIGRDDASTLDQRKSKSVNDDAIITIDNGGAFAADNSYLTWGNNDQATTYGNSYSPTSFSPAAGYFRMNRVWSVQEVGTVGPVTMEIDNNTADHLLVSSDPTFSAGVTEVALSGSSVTFDFADGQYFTFGKELTAPGGVAAGLQFWTKADAGTSTTTDGTAVSQWNDQSLNAFDLTQVTASQQPLYREGTAGSNFNPGLQFNDDFLNNTSRIVETSDGLSMFSIGSIDAIGGINTLLALGDNYNDPALALLGTAAFPFLDGSGSASLFNNQLPVDQPMLMHLRGAIEGTNLLADSLRFGLQGEEVATSLEIVGYNPLYGQNVGVGSDGGGEDWRGLINENIIYNRELTSAETQKVNSYLALKYGVTQKAVDNDAAIVEGDYVSSSDTKVWNYGANSAYHNDVAGIGRDDASSLNQQRSNSVNDGNVVTIDGGGAVTADNSFLVWGNNGQGTAYSSSYNPTSFSPPNGYFRMDRVWKVQETGAVGSVTVANAEAGHLLVSTDPTFSTGVTEIALSGGSATVDFVDGQYFTFGAE